MWLFLAPGSSAFADGELQLRYWSPDMSSTVGFGEEGDPDFDLGDFAAFDLGLEADEVPGALLTLRADFGLFVRAGFEQIDTSGGTTLEVEFDPVPVVISADIESRLEFDYGRFALGWQFGAREDPFTFGIFAEAKGVRGDAGISATALGFTDSLDESFEAALLSAGALLRLRPSSRVEIFAEASVAVDQDEADLTDAEVGIHYLLTDGFGIGAGYRMLQIDGTIDSVLIDIELDGVFASGSLRW